MQSKSVVCLVVDRFHAGMLGPYGNAWIRTPGLDRLASEGFVFDQAFADSTRLASLYRAYWQGLPALSRGSRVDPSVAAVLTEAGVATALVTDEAELEAIASASDFQQRVHLEPGDAGDAETDESQTGMGQLFAAASEWLRGARQPFFLWLHSRGMAGAWDAPLDLRNQYVEEDDPNPPTSAAVPSHRLSEDYDPDAVLGLSYAYAGQVSLLDICLGALVDQIRDSPLADSTLVVLLGARGFPLGEHGFVGPRDEALHNETVQIPWLWRFPDGLGKLGRSQALVEPADLPATLLDWCGIGADRWRGQGQSLLPIMRGEKTSLRDHITMTSAPLALPPEEGWGEGEQQTELSPSPPAPLPRRGEGSRGLDQRVGERAIRTPAWYLKLAVPQLHAADAHSVIELYAKPSDRWEANEVANRCPEIAAGLKEMLLQIEEQGESARLPPLAEPLVTEVD